MARRYDQRTTTFSPEGRLYQVEYAMEAINQAGSTVGIKGSEGVVILAEKKTLSEMLERTSREKIHKIADHITVAVAGLTSDGATLTDWLRQQAQRYQYQFQAPMPVEQLVKTLADNMHVYTQYGGLRPFGVSFLVAGWDKHHGFQLIKVDPSGNYSVWHATAIGQNTNTGVTLLRSDYSEDSNFEDNCKLAAKCMIKMGDSATATPERFETIMVTRVDGQVVIKSIEKSKLQSLLDDAKKAAEADKAD